MQRPVLSLYNDSTIALIGISRRARKYDFTIIYREFDATERAKISSANASWRNKNSIAYVAVCDNGIIEAAKEHFRLLADF